MNKPVIQNNDDKIGCHTLVYTTLNGATESTFSFMVMHKDKTVSKLFFMLLKTLKPLMLETFLEFMSYIYRNSASVNVTKSIRENLNSYITNKSEQYAKNNPDVKFKSTDAFKLLGELRNFIERNDLGKRDIGVWADVTRCFNGRIVWDGALLLIKSDETKDIMPNGHVVRIVAL